MRESFPPQARLLKRLGLVLFRSRVLCVGKHLDFYRHGQVGPSCRPLPAAASVSVVAKGTGHIGVFEVHIFGPVVRLPCNEDPHHINCLSEEGCQQEACDLCGVCGR